MNQIGSKYWTCPPKPHFVQKCAPQELHFLSYNSNFSLVEFIFYVQQFRLLSNDDSNLKSTILHQ